MFKLALQLGKTVNELSNELSNDELIEWIAYDRIDPFGNYRMDAQFAQLLQLATQWMSGESMPLKDYLFVNPNPVSPEVAAEREREAEIERLRAETEAMTKMLFDES
ncbi:MAG: phage tail protein [Moraxella sp.]